MYVARIAIGIDNIMGVASANAMVAEEMSSQCGYQHFLDDNALSRESSFGKIQ